VRELKNLLERALILGQSPELQPEDFFLRPPEVSAERTPEQFTIEALAAQLPDQLNLRETMTRLERALIARSLDLAKGVQAEAARSLGISRSDLGYKVGKHGLLGAPGEKTASGGS